METHRRCCSTPGPARVGNPREQQCGKGCLTVGKGTQPNPGDLAGGQLGNKFPVLIPLPFPNPTGALQKWQPSRPGSKVLKCRVQIGRDQEKVSASTEMTNVLEKSCLHPHGSLPPGPGREPQPSSTQPLGSVPKLAEAGGGSWRGWTWIQAQAECQSSVGSSAVIWLTPGLRLAPTTERNPERRRAEGSVRSDPL